MNETDEPCTIAVTIPNTLEGPVDNMKDKINERTAAVIPVYSISDSDEERANAFMKNMSHSLLTEANTSQPAAELLKNSEVLEAQNTNVDSEIMEADDFNIPSACGQPKEEKPAVTITFMNTDFARKYRHDIEEFFHTLMTAESLSKNHDPLPTIQKRANLKGRVLDESTVIGSISVCVLSHYINTLIYNTLKHSLLCIVSLSTDGMVKFQCY
ncbi:ZCCHC8 [Bugula neritina]|uniref:ZCCHC8 n=1 Tax=Bugula neritina TaxID=10212 RepID=A0A7J7JHA5_BUGNE|nr:ZCCHC8 [Bugula neritina]